MTFKVGHGQKSGPEVARNNASGQPHSHGHNEHSETRGGKTHAHDNTPARQRELETHGHNLRARVEGQSHKGGDEGHSQRSQHSQHSKHSQYSQQSQHSQQSQQSEHSQHSENFSFARSDRGVGVRVNGDAIGGEIEVRLGLNRSHGGDHSQDHSQRSEHLSSVRSDRGVGVRIDGDAMGGEIEARVGLNRSHGGDRSHHSHGDTDGRADVHGHQDGGKSKADSSFNQQRHSSEHFSTRNDSGRTSDHHHSELRNGFQRDSDHNWGKHSSERTNRATHEFRDSLRTLRNDLNAFRSDSRDRPGNNTIHLTDRHIERVLHLATRGLDRISQGGHSERSASRVIAEALGVVRVAEHFSHLESTGGEPVRRAYQAVINFLLNDREPDSNRLRLVTELLRDLGSGAFLNVRDLEGPFPLTGRARIVSEMMELMRTLEAIERFAEQMRANPNRIFTGDLSVFARGDFLRGVIGSDVVELLAQVLANSSPNFPGLAGRLEIPRLIAALDGVLTDATGRPLIMADGTPLKLGEMLWFNARPESAVDLWAFDRFPTRLSPILIHGFDAVYSLIGFDGRPLTLPRFVAIQSQINASEFEWLFGHAPLSEGWIRSAIEFLKDSISVDHNVLGELLEEAVTSGRFHLTVMRGTVEEGRAVSGSFSFTPVHNLCPAFSPLAR